ncbi:CRISPR-associated protein Cst1 [Cetobacterium ceti]|uniref:CRISPR-associated protein Cst1 n=1 Tax=Cetobacterium ceti TaxID=180163 RepID=A0A1T4MAL5_9FUSO|nr:type I CRISPR-associated protein Cas8a1/Csx8 [Cetobacterium ceti]SJZ63808.1 CRISPR-associated protein Cst1 [Cetobacterium ceti]
MTLVRVEPFDWRWSASIVGLLKYLENYNIDYTLTEDYLEFDKEEITEERYYNFVELYFENNMHHRTIEKIIKNMDNEELNSEELKLLNEKMKGNQILKKVFSNFKYEIGKEKDILKLIDENRREIIENTYKNGKSLYANFGNPNALLKEKGKICRLNGYYMDMPKKGRSITYGFNSKALSFTDNIYFDFIPFGFSRSREGFFINCNLDLRELERVNRVEFNEIGTEENRTTFKSNLLNNTFRSARKLNYDMEVIVKNMEKDYYETLYIRKDAINILRKISEEIKEIILRPCKVGRNNYSVNEWIPVSEIVVDSILNLKKLDDFIEFLLKVDGKKFLRGALIKINSLIYKEERNMNENFSKTVSDARRIKEFFKSKPNKLRTYEQKLISAIGLKDYDRVKEIMIHMSSTSQLPIRTLILLFEDFEKNKNLAYTFINEIGEVKNEK